MNRFERIAVSALLGVLAPTAALHAHGGQYRGPGAPAPAVAAPAPGPAPAPAPAPAAPRAPGPATGPTTGGVLPPDLTTWEVWWEFNKDPFLQLRRAIHSGAAISGSDDFFMGGGRRPVPRDTMEPSAREKRERIVPALNRALQATRNRDITSACLIALAKVGSNAPGVELVPTLMEHLARKDQEIRETAALALGIAGLPEALPPLLDLLDDTPNGRKLINRLEVDDRTRAFAAYAIGLLAGRRTGSEIKERAFAALSPILSDRSERNRDLVVAVVHGLGLLAPDPDRSGAEKRLLWQTLDVLWQYYRRDLGKGDELLQAHVPVAVARLLGRGTAAEHQRSKQALAAELTGKRRRNNAVYQSAALALGALCVPGEQHPEDLAFSTALSRYYRDGHDLQARFFCLIALGRIGGERNRGELMTFYAGGNKATEKPWAAVALGIVGRATRDHALSSLEVDEGIGRLLRRDLGKIDNRGTMAALAIGLGLCGYREAAPELRALLRRHHRQDKLGGYLCVSLALMDDEMAIDQIRTLVRESVRRPFLLQQASVALGRLGDKTAADLLQEMMPHNDNVAALSAIAAALGFIGDRRSIDPLIDMLEDEELTKLARAFVAAALGGVGDKDLLPWSTPLAVDANYRASVDTLTNGQTGVLDIL